MAKLDSYKICNQKWANFIDLVTVKGLLMDATQAFALLEALQNS